MYEPLRPRQIRLISIVHDNNEEHGFLLHLSHTNISTQTPFAATNPYCALSYTWGGTDQVSITIRTNDGILHSFSITDSLLVALKRIAEGTEYRVPLWIDQISINQTDQIEKALQIPMMRAIYEAASSVVIWIGEAGQDSDLAIDVIRAIRTQIAQLQTQDAAFKQSYLHPNIVMKLVQQNDSHERAVEKWTAVARLLKRRWFTRGWVIQEATSQPASSQGARVLCGSKVFPFNFFIALRHLLISMTLYGDIPALNELTSVLGGPFDTIMNFWHMRAATDYCRLLDLIRFCRPSQLTDQRDKVYTVFSFATDIVESTNPLVPSYSISAERLYLDFALWHLYEHRNLDFLGSCEPRLDVNQRKVPCWAPDWRYKIVEAMPKYDQHWSRSPSAIFDASRATTLKTPHPAAFGELPRALTVSGHFLGRVFPFVWNSPWLKYDSSLWNSRCPLNDKSFGEMLARTLCLDLRRRPNPDGVMRNERNAFCKVGQKLPDSKWRILNDIDGASATMDVRVPGRLLFILPELEKAGISTAVLGMGPWKMLPGDELWMINGGKTLYILRPCMAEWDESIPHVDTTTTDPATHFQLKAGDVFHDFVGEAFVLGLMNGEVPAMFQGQEPQITHVMDLVDTMRKVRDEDETEPEVYPNAEFEHFVVIPVSGRTEFGETSQTALDIIDQHALHENAVS